MPELPEVETIRRQLNEYLVGHVIEDVEVRLAKQISGDISRVRESKIQRVRRFGKGLVIDLDNDYSIAIHIKMTGQLIYKASESQSGKESKMSKKVGELPGKATHVIFKLKVGEQKAYLYYNDTRQFGWIKIVKTDDVGELPFFKSLGPEALKDLTFEKFTEILKSTKGPVKPLLMEQSKMAGVGNIYANDALYRAKIHPKRSANSLTKEESKRLFDSLEEVLKKGLEAGGSSEWAYVDALGQEGSYQKIFLVYGQVGKPCLRCGTKIEKITLGGRGTFFCPECQKV
jgi:formamidopyrimidine-DNA glycosylase